MSENVLVPVDGSPLSVRALRHALAEFPDASITALHVIDLFDPAHGHALDASYEPVMGSEAWYERAEEIEEQLFEEVRTVADDYGREVTTASEIGDPERVVVDYADGEDVDHVVIGAHGRPDGDRALFGSVAEAVVRRATVPVTVVR